MKKWRLTMDEFDQKFADFEARIYADPDVNRPGYWDEYEAWLDECAARNAYERGLELGRA